VSLYLRVPLELHERLRAIAEYEGRSVNSQATRLLQAGVKQYEDEHGDELGRQPD
jgi:predicted HicB family RNase H-like nuclease